MMCSRTVIGKESPAYSMHTIGEERLVLDKQFSEYDTPANVGIAYHPKLNFLAPRPRFLYYKPKSRTLGLGDDTYAEEKVGISDISTPSDIGNVYHPKLNNLAPRPRFLYYKPRSRPLELGDDTCSEEEVSISVISTTSDVGQEFFDDGSREPSLSRVSDATERVDGSSLLHHRRIGRTYLRGLSKTLLSFLIIMCWVSIMLNPIRKIGFSWKDNSRCLSRSFLVKTPILKSDKNHDFTNNFSEFYIEGIHADDQLDHANTAETDGIPIDDPPHLNFDVTRREIDDLPDFRAKFVETVGIHTDREAIMSSQVNEIQVLPELLKLRRSSNHADSSSNSSSNVTQNHIDDMLILNSKVTFVFVYFKFVETFGIPTDREAIMSSQVNDIQVLPELLKLIRSSKHADSSSNSSSHVTQNDIDDMPILNSKVIVVFVYFKFVETVGIHTDREAIMSSQINEIQVLPELLKLRRSSKHADSSSNSSSHVTQNHIDDLPILNSEVIVVFVYILLYIIAGIYAYFEEPSLGNGSTEMNVPVESYPSKLCTFQMGSYEDLEKKRKKIYRTTTLSSLDSISGSASYGSFITHENVSSKRGSGDAAIVAPVRLSWRIKNRVVRGVGIANA